MNAQNRLFNELKNVRKSRPFGFYAKPTKDIMHWNCQIMNEGYYFPLCIVFTKSYPTSPPIVKFRNSIFHPNVYSNRSVCLDLLSSKWRPSINIKDILVALVQLLNTPNPTSPANSEASKLYLSDREAYDKKVKEVNDMHHRRYSVL